MPLEFYYTLLALCCGYAFLKGGAPERIGTTVLAVGSIATLVAVWSWGHRYRSLEAGIFIVDVVCLVAFLALALRAERYWPSWIAALQIIGTAAHAVKLADPTVIGRAYAFAMAFWSYPMLFLLVLGTWRHQQRLKRFGTDRSWSSSWARSAPPPGPTS